MPPKTKGEKPEKKKAKPVVDRMSVRDLRNLPEQVKGASGKEILDYIVAQKGEGVTVKDISDATKVPLEAVRSRVAMLKKQGKIQGYKPSGYKRGFYFVE